MCQVMRFCFFGSNRIYAKAAHADISRVTGGLNQGRSQNAKKVAHIKGRLLGQVVVLFNCSPFQNGNFS